MTQKLTPKQLAHDEDMRRALNEVRMRLTLMDEDLSVVRRYRDAVSRAQMTPRWLDVMRARVAKISQHLDKAEAAARGVLDLDSPLAGATNLSCDEKGD